MTVQVVTDSSCCLSPSQLAVNGIRQAALHVLLEGREVPDCSGGAAEDDGLGGDWLSGPGLSTAAANEEELAAVYREALAASSQDGVVAVHLSGALSATAASAQRAAERFGAQVVVVDSRQVAMGVGFAALAAARAAAGGAGLAEAAEAARGTAAAASTWGYVDKLDWLRRSGRIPRTTWLMGTALSIRPVLRLGGGKLQIAERTRTRSRAFDALVELAVTRFGGGRAAVALRHQEAEEHAVQLAEALSARLHLSQAVDIGPVNRVLGAHLGGGAVLLTAIPS